MPDPSPKSAKTRPTISDQYDPAEWDAILLDGKAPVEKGWRKPSYDTQRARKVAVKRGQNLGIRLRPDQLVLDIDPRNGGDASFERLCSDISLDPSALPCVKTGSGGRHYYMRLPDGFRAASRLMGYPGIDLVGHGKQVVAAGSIHPDTGRRYRFADDSPPLADIPMVPKCLRRVIRRKAVDSAPVEAGEYTPEQIAAMLAALRPEDFRVHDEWLKLMQAVHHASNGAARAEFIEWSVTDPEYSDAAETIGARWDSLHTDRDEAVTAATLRYLLEEHGAEAAIPPGDAAADFSPYDDEDPDDDVKPERAAIQATPFVWLPPSQIPRRAWLYRPVYIRNFVGLTAATGGAGKSSLILVELLAMASGRPLLGIEPERPLRVWYWNGEDPADELRRRLQAAMRHFGIKPEEIEGRFFLDSGRDLEIKLAVMKNGAAKIAQPVVNDVVATLRANRIDVLAIDPFVSSHSVPENDNGATDMVAKKWADIADKAGCAIHLSHHTRKANGNAATIEDARGASALNYAARVRRALNTMTKAEAVKAGLDEETQRRAYFRADLANSSMIPPAEAASWYHITSVDLGNGEFPEPGDNVGVVEPWEYVEAKEPDLGENERDRIIAAIEKAGGTMRADPRADGWIGNVFAEVLNIFPDPDMGGYSDADRKAITRHIENWCDEGILEKTTVLDRQSKPRPAYKLCSPDAANTDEDFG